MAAENGESITDICSTLKVFLKVPVENATSLEKVVLVN